MSTSTKTKVEFKQCGCGCGTPVAPKYNYRPGHDARHVGMVIRGEAPFGALPSEALKAKAKRGLDLVMAKREGKTNETGTVKIGRWTYPAERSATGGVRYQQRGVWVGATKAKVIESFVPGATA